MAKDLLSVLYSNIQVWLSRMDGHMGLANSLALKRAGITNDTEDPAGGTIIRTANGGRFRLSILLK